MEANDLEIPSEGEFQLETTSRIEYPISVKSMNKIRNKRIKMNCKTYRKLLLEEQSRLLKEEKILQGRLQKYFDLESELKQILSKMNINLNEVNQSRDKNTDSKEEHFKITDFVIKLRKMNE